MTVKTAAPMQFPRNARSGVMIADANRAPAASASATSP
jgi:hypothetical protein